VSVEYVLPGDAEAAYLVAICQELHSLGSYRDIPFDWQFMLENARMIIHSDTHYACLARSPEYGVFGYVAGNLEWFWFSPQCYAQEGAWYVRAGVKDRAKTAFALMRSFVKWAESKGALMVQSGDIANIDTVAVHGAYTRLGFKRYGVIYKYERAG